MFAFNIFIECESQFCALQNLEEHGTDNITDKNNEKVFFSLSLALWYSFFQSAVTGFERKTHIINCSEEFCPYPHFTSRFLHTLRNSTHLRNYSICRRAKDSRIRKIHLCTTLLYCSYWHQHVLTSSRSLGLSSSLRQR